MSLVIVRFVLERGRNVLHGFIGFALIQQKPRKAGARRCIIGVQPKEELKVAGLISSQVSLVINAQDLTILWVIRQGLEAKSGHFIGTVDSMAHALGRFIGISD